MKKLLIFLVLVGYTSFNYSQTLIQTFTDRCTGATQVFQIPMTGATTVVFYDRAQTFTAEDVKSGAFRAWLEETYAWWAALNPCSAAQAESTTAQQTAQQTTSAATSAATNAASAPPPTTSTTNTTSNATTNNASSSTDSTSSSQSTDSTSSSSSEPSQTETSDSSGGGESTEDSGGGETSDSEGGDSEETSSEENSESESEESESESESEEESESEGEDSDDDGDGEEEKKEEKKKKSLAPPILAANMMANQMLDGSWTTAAAFGVSQSSLTGQETYSANAMIWSNLKQFSLGLSKSKVHFWREKQIYSEVLGSNGKWRSTQGDPVKQNQIHHVGTTTFNYMNIYGTNVITVGYSRVILGQDNNFWNGFAGGYAATNSIIILPESTLYSPALTLFGTKPVSFKSLPRWGFAPMVAVSLTPLQIINSKNQYNKNQAEFIWNEYFTYIIGTGANFKLTQRFVANLGINTINNTNPIIPTTFAITIGARFAF